ncbi:Aquaporin PIP1-5, partial [Mucuna pruriens]
MDSANSHVLVKQLPRSVQTSQPICLVGNNNFRRKCLASIGAHEIFRPEMWKAALTELTATASLVFTLTTSIIACMDSHVVDPKLLVPLAVFIIAFLFLLVTVPLTGGHMSPVFTFIAALKGVVTLTRALIYVLAQCTGSIIGFFILRTVMEPRLADTYSLGGCAIGATKAQDALLVEFTCTFVVLFVGVTLAFDKKRSKDLGLPMVCMVIAGAMALAVFVSLTVTGRAGYAGVGLSPARCLGPALFHGGSLWEGHWVFWLGPFLACILYYALSVNLPKEGLVWVDGEYDVLNLPLASPGTLYKTSLSNDGPERPTAGSMDTANSHVVVDIGDQLPRDLVHKKCSGPKFLTSIGAHEFFTIETWKAGLVELTATAALMFSLTSSNIACLESHEVNPRLLIPFSVFIIVFLFLIATVPLSGGHMNPVFTFVAALKGVVTLSRALIYVLAQCIGSIIGFFILKTVMEPKLTDTYSLGGCAIGQKGQSSAIEPQDALLLEFFCTFLVLFVGLTLAFDKKRCKDLGLPMVCLVVAGSLALAVFVSITITGRPGYAGVGLSPARCLGPALLHGGSLWNGHWVFWLGPFLACIIYYSVSINLPKKGLCWVDGEYDILNLALGSCGTISNNAV